MQGKTSEKGQALVLVAIGIVALLAMTALAVDGGNVYMDRRKAQSAANAAALAAGVRKIQDGDCTNCASVARSRAAANGYNNDGTSNTVVVNNPPGASCSGTTPTFSDDSSRYVQVLITTNVRTYFAPVIGVQQTHNCVDAIAKMLGTPALGEALVALGQGNPAISTGGNGTITIQNGGIWDNGGMNRSGASILLANSSGQNITACGNYSENGSGYYSPTPTYPCPGGPISDPYPSLSPPAKPAGSCVSGIFSTTQPLSPNVCYNGLGASGHGNVTLNPGIYYVDTGDFSVAVQATVTGAGVMIYLRTGGISVTSGATLNLTAYASDPYKGLVFYVDRANSSPVSLNAQGNTTLTGSVYAPASAITLGGGSTGAVLHSQMIGNTISLSGGSGLTLDYVSSEQYTPTSIQFYQ